MIFPGTAHASLLSFLSSLVGQNVSAQETMATTTLYNSQTLPLLEAAVNIQPMSTSTNVLAIADEALIPSIGPAGSIDDINNQPIDTSPSFYIVQPKDTISLIAEMFNVSVVTIKSANNLSVSAISPGQALIIPPVSGLTYTIKKGDTISSIIAKYKSNMTDVLEYNDISATSTSAIAVGDSIFIPGADTGLIGSTGNTPTRTSSGIKYNPFIPGDAGPVIPGYYTCPVHGSWLSQGLHGHNAVDLAIGIGNPIDAAANGTVIIAKSGGWDGGYGNYIVISHPNGTETLYAHAKKLFVTAGEQVTRGEEIAEIGVTGETTGPHLHFEVRGAANPFVTVKC
jgi:LysM repeat protein